MPSDLRRRLLARISRKYRLISSPLEFTGLKIDFLRIADPNRVLDELAEAEDRREKIEGRRRDGDELHLPYWAELWDSALALCDELVALSPSAGTPACGELSRTGEGGGEGKRIESSDHLIIESLKTDSSSSMIQCSDDSMIQFPKCPHPNPLPEYRERGEEATLKGKTLLDLGCGMGLVGTVAAALGASVTLADLESDALLLARCNAMQFDSAVRAVRLNWRTGRLDQRFDFIIGADIIYERAQWEFLEPFWRNHLAPAGTIFLGEPGRPGGDSFPAWICERGWRIDILSRLAPATGKKIRIMRLGS